MGILSVSIIVLVTAVVAAFLPYYMRHRTISQKKLHFGGKVKRGYEEVEKVFRENFVNGYEPGGAAFAAYYKGELVADLWGGYADTTALRKWQENTLSMAFSTTKAVGSICLAMLVDRGLISYDDLVIKHWPEFGQNGKAEITVKMLLSHQAGLAAFDGPFSLEEATDWKLASRRLEKQSPLWAPGTAMAYHAFTFGFLIDQLVRRVDPKHRSVGTFLREEITEPNGLELYIGLPRELEYRVARLTSARIMDLLALSTDIRFLSVLKRMLFAPATSVIHKITNNVGWLVGPSGFSCFNDPDLRAIELVSSNGVGTARSLAALFALAGEPGRLFRNASLIEMISKPTVVDFYDDTVALPVSRGYGFWYWNNPTGQYQFGHPGYGGQNAKLDVENKLAFAYLRNHLVPDINGETPSLLGLEEALYRSIKKAEH